VRVSLERAIQLAKQGGFRVMLADGYQFLAIVAVELSTQERLSYLDIAQQIFENENLRGSAARNLLIASSLFMEKSEDAIKRIEKARRLFELSGNELMVQTCREMSM
jgi:hypothetical protein